MFCKNKNELLFYILGVKLSDLAHFENFFYTHRSFAATTAYPKNLRFRDKTTCKIIFTCTFCLQNIMPEL